MASDDRVFGIVKIILVAYFRKQPRGPPLQGVRRRYVLPVIAAIASHQRGTGPQFAELLYAKRTCSLYYVIVYKILLLCN